jgi:hypothetical protein
MLEVCMKFKPQMLKFCCQAINVIDVTLRCAISHQVTKIINKLEESRSTLLFYHSKLQHVKLSQVDKLLQRTCLCVAQSTIKITKTSSSYLFMLRRLETFASSFPVH